MKLLLITASILSIFFFSKEDCSKISVNEKGVFFGSKLYTNQTANSIISLLGEPDNIKRKRKRFPNELVYSKEGITFTTVPGIYNDSLKVRSIGLKYKEGLKKNYEGVFTLCGEEVKLGVNRKYIINNEVISKYIVYYEVCRNDEEEHLIELLIDTTFLRLIFHESKGILSKIYIYPDCKDLLGTGDKWKERCVDWK